jgi:DNA-binding MarR family transcriptional regulator
MARAATRIDPPPARPAAPGPAANDAPGRFVSGYLPYLLARASHLISGEFHRQLKAQRVPVMTWRVMASLWDGPMSAREVADIILQKQPTVSKLLERMERQGLVNRVTDVDDRRRIAVSLSARGRAVAGPLIEAARGHEQAVLEPFGERNAAALLAVLQRLIDQHADRD